MINDLTPEQLKQMSFSECQTALAGTELVAFSFSVTSHPKQGSENPKIETSPTAFDRYRSNVGPAPKCDILIGNSSTNLDRIFEINPDVMTLSDDIAFFRGELKCFGYCLPENLETVKQVFFEYAKKKRAEYIARLEAEIANLNAADLG